MSEPIQSIAQNNYILHNIDAKKLYVQEPLFTANSGDAVYVGWRPDETVLWENMNGTQSGCSLSEPITNFERILISYGQNNGRQMMQVDPRLCSGGSNVPLTIIPTFNNGYASIYTQSWRFSNTTTFVSSFKAKELWGNTAAVSARDTGNQYVYGLTGINRKENA